MHEEHRGEHLAKKDSVGLHCSEVVIVRAYQVPVAGPVNADPVAAAKQTAADAPGASA